MTLCQPPARRNLILRLIDSFGAVEINIPCMKHAVDRLNAEYHLNLSDQEIETIAKQAEAGQRLFETLFQVDVQGVPPALKIDPAEKK